MEMEDLIHIRPTHQEEMHEMAVVRREVIELTGDDPAGVGDLHEQTIGCGEGGGETERLVDALAGG